MKKIVSIVMILLMIGNIGCFASTAEIQYPPEDQSYNNGVLVLTINESYNNPVILKLQDGEIIEKGISPSMIVMIKFHNNADYNNSEILEISIVQIPGNSNETVPYPDSIILKLRGDAIEPDLINPDVIVLNLRGDVIEPEAITPEITILDLRGDVIEPEAITPEIILN